MARAVSSWLPLAPPGFLLAPPGTSWLPRLLLTPSGSSWTPGRRRFSPTSSVLLIAASPSCCSSSYSVLLFLHATVWRVACAPVSHAGHPAVFPRVLWKFRRARPAGVSSVPRVPWKSRRARPAGVSSTLMFTCGLIAASNCVFASARYASTMSCSTPLSPHGLQARDNRTPSRVAMMCSPDSWCRPSHSPEIHRRSSFGSMPDFSHPGMHMRTGDAKGNIGDLKGL